METNTEWKRPSVIIKRNKKKRVSLQPVSDSPNNRSTVIENSQGSKRKNPFSTSDIFSKRNKHVNEEFVKPELESTCTFFAVLDNADAKNGAASSIRIEKATQDGKLTRDNVIDEDDVSQFDFIEKFSIAQLKKNENASSPAIKKDEDNVKKEVTERTKKHQNVPIDWSLKAKMRVVSDTSLLWCTQVKTAEEAKGLEDFVTCRHLTVVDHSGNKPWFQSCCLYWIYPSMPWLRLFPRIVPDSKIRSTSVSLLDPDVNTELQNDWTESFSSVFHQLRSQKCPYFYVCTHQFTVLFRAAGIAGQSAINAFLTPTTRGFREALKKEGIAFEMPVLERKRNSTKHAGDNDSPNQTEKPSSENGKEEDSGKQVEEKDDDKDEYDDEFLETDEGASVWLESIGLDKKYFPSLDPDKVKIQREGFKVIDNRPESLVYVQGGDVQGLFNYLLNCRSCVSTTGPLAGVPPTILAPSPFKGATLKSHKVKHSIVRQKELDFRNKQMHILEIVGPILPHHIQRFSALFSHTQNNNYSFTFNTHEPTVPFNFDLPFVNSDDSVEKEREKLDMQEDVHNSFFDVIEISDRLSSIKELHRSKEGYSWIT